MKGKTVFQTLQYNFHFLKTTKKGPILVEKDQLWLLIFPRWNNYLSYPLSMNSTIKTFVVFRSSMGLSTNLTTYGYYAPEFVHIFIEKILAWVTVFGQVYNFLYHILLAFLKAYIHANLVSI